MKRTSIPADFVVSAGIRELARKKDWAKPEDEIEAFIDHHLAKGDLMADWEAAFRTWLRNEKRWRKNKTPSRERFAAAPTYRQLPDKKGVDPKVRRMLKDLADKFK